MNNIANFSWYKNRQIREREFYTSIKSIIVEELQTKKLSKLDRAKAEICIMRRKEKLVEQYAEFFN